MTLAQARMVSAQCWLRECGIDFVMVNAYWLEIKVGRVTVDWIPADRIWWHSDSDRMSDVIHGSQPDFAVFLRRLRDGRLAA